MTDTIAAMRARQPRFDTIVQLVREKGTDSLSHFGNGYTHEGGYSLQQNPEEFASLLLLLRERAMIHSRRAGLLRRPLYLEIGSASGGAARMLYEEIGFTAMISIDDHGHHRWVEQAANWQTVPMQTFVGDSHGSEAKEFVHRQLSFVDDPIVAFIDGDHSYEGARADSLLMKPYLRSGSLVIFHDTVACEGVQRVFDETSAWAVKIANYVGGGYRPLGIGVLEVL